MKLLTWIVLVPAIVVVVAFAIANRGMVTVRFDPLPFALDLPLFALALGTCFLGLLVGGIAAWSRGRRWRRLARRQRRELERLEGALRAARAGEARPGVPARVDAA